MQRIRTNVWILAVALAPLACEDPSTAPVSCVTQDVYEDLDLDGWGNEEVTQLSCGVPQGWSAAKGDCDDVDGRRNPAAPEVCNGVDDDCDGGIDDGLLGTWYFDRDEDGYGDEDTAWQDCLPSIGVAAVDRPGDCDDHRPEVNPGAEEVCDRVDNDCDGGVDLNAVDALPWYLDMDGDDYGGDYPGIMACERPLGQSATNTDCDDLAPTVYPGAQEIVDELDNDCDGTVDG